MRRAVTSSFSWLRLMARSVAASVDELFPSVVGEEVAAAREEGWHVDVPAAYCGRCGATVGPGEVTARGCSRCVGQAVAWDRLIRLSAYQPPVASWVVAMKFHRQWSWCPWLGAQLALVSQEMIQHSASHGDASDAQSNVTPSRGNNAADAHAGNTNAPRHIVCPVPIPWMRRWVRRYSQSWLMADAFARAARLPLASLLRRVGWQSPQMSMHGHQQREENVRHAFAIAPVDLTGWTVWLIDDVKTSGATLTACAKLLRQAGADRIHVAVAAVADPKNADFKVK